MKFSQLYFCAYIFSDLSLLFFYLSKNVAYEIFVFTPYYFATLYLLRRNIQKIILTRRLDIPMQLSGNFGELRPNHFHAGFDLKTNQREGLNVYAVADGYISRIKISTFGNGKCIYITHPNGYTSVYGHLQTAIGRNSGLYSENAL